MNRDKVISFVKYASIIATVVAMLILIAKIILIFFVGLRLIASSDNIEKQTGSLWRSDDDTIEFTVIDGDGQGIMRVGEETLDVELVLGSSTMRVSVYLADAPRGGPFAVDSLESWELLDQTGSTFTVRVERTTYYEEGQIIVFTRVAE